MAHRYTLEQIDRILDHDSNALNGLDKLERSGVEIDRVKTLVLSIANGPYEAESMERRKLPSSYLAKHRRLVVPVRRNGRPLRGKRTCLPPGTQWSDKRLQALPQKLLALADEVDLAFQWSGLGTSVPFWWGPSLDSKQRMKLYWRIMELPERIREGAEVLRRVIYQPTLYIGNDMHERTRRLLLFVKGRMRRKHYLKAVSFILTPIYAEVGLDPEGEGLPSPKSLKMLMYREDQRFRKFQNDSLRHQAESGFPPKNS